MNDYTFDLLMALIHNGIIRLAKNMLTQETCLSATLSPAG